MKTIFNFCPIQNPCLYNRIYLPAIHSKHDNIEHTVGTNLPTTGFDAVHIHGVHNVEDIVEFLRFKIRGIKVLWSIDDDYLSIPMWNGNALNESRLEFYQMATALADSIIVTNASLDATFKRTSDCHVAPNLIAEVVDFQKPKNDVVKILWQGSTTHKEDLAIVGPALENVLGKYGDKVEMVYWGSNPTDELYKQFAYKNLTIEDAVPIAKYHKKLKAINPDIVVAPLVDCPFNRSKSNLRILDAWSCKAAVIASSVGDYRSTINAGIDGILTNDNFQRYLEMLIEEEQYRKDLQEEGFARCKKDYNWATDTKWVGVFERCLQ